ncbi:Hypothetical protein SMAX5B_022157 [Scophthalmus maximus]|uniref:Uncharacterized protein n=1 Tax=Scophthalmus maximus TaxID=52904 RepID=A0A2U9B7B1_SCOMX|nr:Hypothetical protein SMAX5B_022157 [Scophthalmus maximus]
MAFYDTWVGNYDKVSPKRVTVKELWDRILDGGLLCHGALCQSRIVHDLWSELGSHSCQCRPRDVQRLQNQSLLSGG